MADAPPAAAVLDNDRPCVVCGYNLKGLPFDGKCPECGSPVQRSLHGNLLRFSSAEYLATLHRGVFLIQAGIVTQIVARALAIFAGILATALSGSGVGEIIRLSMGLISTGAGLVGLVGWWLLSAPDPAFIGTENGNSARRVVQVTVFINAIASATAFLPDTSAAVRNFSAINAAVALVWAVNAAALIAWVVWFFAAMRYLQWLAPRLPDPRVTARAKTMMWLGPILYTVGAIACGLGPLVALILYYNLLNWVREALQAIRADQSLREAAGIPL